jgi:hypothetical protein
MSPQKIPTGVYPVKRVQIFWDGGSNATTAGSNAFQAALVLQGPLTFDATISEAHDREADVTDYPVEEGANVADHVRPRPKTLTLETFVSNEPIGSPDAVRQGLYLQIDQPPGSTGLSPQTLGLGVSSQADRGDSGPTIGAQLAARIGVGESQATSINPLVDQFTGATDYVKNAFDQLSLLQESAALLQVFTPRQPAYKNMVIRSLRMRRDKDCGTGGYITIDMVQIRVVASAVAPAPQPTVLRAQEKQAAGNKETTPADSGKKDSIIHHTDAYKKRRAALGKFNS